jgi:hypothetical protein
MQESPIQILEVRAGEGTQPTMITAAVTGDASREICTALSEQLDRRRQEPTTSAEDVLALRDHAALVERFEPLAASGAHAVVSFSESDVRACLFELTRYTDRVDGEHFQPPDLRERLQLIAEAIPVLWEANGLAAEANAALERSLH